MIYIKIKIFLQPITLILLLFTYLILVKCSANYVLNGNGKYQMTDGTTYGSCEEYKSALGKNVINGVYEQSGQPNSKMYCLMDGTEWKLYKEYEIIFQRIDGSVDMDLDWNQSKVGVFGETEWWAGFDHIRQKCGTQGTCDFVMMMVTKAGTWTTGGLYVTVFLNDWYIEDEANKFTLKFSSKSQGQEMAGTNRVFDYHQNQKWTTKDNDNDNNSQNCGGSGGPFWHNNCYYANPFHPWDVTGIAGACFHGADTSLPDNDSQCDNLNYVAFGVRTHNTGGDGINAYNGIGSIDIGGLKTNCDHSVCGTCSGNRTNCIIPCQSNCGVCDPTGSCGICQQGYQLDDNSVCQVVCDNTQCATCSGQADNCILNCNSGCKTCISDQTCDTCEEGKWVDNGTCSNCDMTVCGTQGECIDCDDGRWLNDGQCDLCDQTVCATCITNSTDCDKACNLNCKDKCDVNGHCLDCNLGRWLDNNGQCNLCDYSICATCQNSNQNCILQCNQDCKTCLPDQTCDSCEDGKFLDNGSCNPCDDTICATCQTSSNQCILNCNSGCETCNIDQTCKSCDDGKFLKDGVCEPCGYKCNKCINSADFCIECSDISRDDSDNKCNCKIGFYETNNNEVICNECDSKCLTCNNQSNQCIECSDISRSNPPTCSCADNYFSDLSGDCIKCQFDNCKCTLIDFCDECIGEDNNLRVLPQCYCKIGYYEDINGICQKCSVHCVSCVQENECLECKYGYGRNVNLPTCGCQLQHFYYDQQQDTCQECLPQCLTCKNSYECTSCNNLQDGKILKLPKCLNTLSQHENTFISFSVDIQGNQIETQGICSKKCEQCQLSQENCTVCRINDQYRNQTPPYCNCLQGYHDNEQQLVYCQKCKKPCETCISEDKCLSCKSEDNRVLNQFNLKCQCLKGFKPSKDNNMKCTKCYIFQGKCVSNCPKNTMMDQKLGICVNENYILFSSQSTIFISGIIILLLIFFIKFSLIQMFYSKVKQIQIKPKSGLQIEKQENQKLKNDQQQVIKSTDNEEYL